MAADLSSCDRCGRAVPPSNNPEFASWTVVKDEETKRVAGMRCPACQAAEPGEG
jgi:DNA-directed RNA polymerase subunit RPC12/RpoP